MFHRIGFQIRILPILSRTCAHRAFTCSILRPTTFASAKCGANRRVPLKAAERETPFPAPSPRNRVSPSRALPKPHFGNEGKLTVEWVRSVRAYSELFGHVMFNPFRVGAFGMSSQG